MRYGAKFIVNANIKICSFIAYTARLVAESQQLVASRKNVIVFSIYFHQFCSNLQNIKSNIAAWDYSTGSRRR